MGDQLSVSTALPVRCLSINDGPALAIIYRVISTYLIHQAGYAKRTATTGAVTLIQRFGNALNLNVHFHNAVSGWYLGRRFFREIALQATIETEH